MDQTFNLKITFNADCYDGDWLIDASVTYPEMVFHEYATHTFPSVTVKYDRLGDDSPDKVAKRMVRDMVSFVRDPREWEENYIAQSTDLGQRIKHLQENLEETEKQIERQISSLEQEKRHYADLLQQRAELQARFDAK